MRLRRKTITSPDPSDTGDIISKASKNVDETDSFKTYRLTLLESCDPNI